MTEKEIKVLATKLYEDILKAYNANPNITYTEILNEYMLKYSDEVAKQLNVELANITNATVGGLSSTVKPLGGVALSSVLYKNSEYVAKQVMKVINEHLLLKSTVDEIRKSIYDGFGYGGIEEILKAAKLPKYLTEKLTEAQIKKLKTKSLAAGYFEVLDAKTDRALKKALEVAAQEKARWFAYRIVDVEEQKAFNLMIAQEHLDDGVQYVKVTLSASHKTTCICDYIASVNVGYGRGVTKLRDAKIPPYHPFCLTGDSLISSRYPISRIFKRTYEGAIYTITTKNGNTIKCTPNHPILTIDGFVAASAIEKGGEIICDSICKGERISDVQDDNGVSRIDDLFVSLNVSSRSTSTKMPVASEYFHGDGTPNSEVHIINIDSSLRNKIDSSFIHSIKNHLLKTRMYFSFGLNRLSSLKFRISTLFSSSNGIMGFFGTSFAIFRRKSFGGSKTGFGLRSGNDSSLFKSASDSSPTYTDLSRNIQNGSLGDSIFVDSIVDIKINFSRTHVYNLENDLGYYTTNGIINHNCRCRLVPVEVKRTWSVTDPKQSALDNFTKAEQRKIESGLRSKWSRPTVGDVF